MVFVQLRGVRSNSLGVKGSQVQILSSRQRNRRSEQGSGKVRSPALIIFRQIFGKSWGSAVDPEMPCPLMWIRSVLRTLSKRPLSGLKRSGTVSLGPRQGAGCLTRSEACGWLSHSICDTPYFVSFVLRHGA
jgi:hypothetical protein